MSKDPRPRPRPLPTTEEFRSMIGDRRELISEIQTLLAQYIADIRMGVLVELVARQFIAEGEKDLPGLHEWIDGEIEGNGGRSVPTVDF